MGYNELYMKNNCCGIPYSKTLDPPLGADQEKHKVLGEQGARKKLSYIGGPFVPGGATTRDKRPFRPG